MKKRQVRLVKLVNWIESLRIPREFNRVTENLCWLNYIVRLGLIKTTPEPDVGSTTSIRDTDIKLLSRTVTRCSVTYCGAEPRYTNQVSDIQDPIHIGERVTNTNLAQRLEDYE